MEVIYLNALKLWKRQAWTRKGFNTLPIVKVILSTPNKDIWLYRY